MSAFLPLKNRGKRRGSSHIAFNEGHGAFLLYMQLRRMGMSNQEAGHLVSVAWYGEPGSAASRALPAGAYPTDALIYSGLVVWRRALSLLGPLHAPNIDRLLYESRPW